MRLFYIATLTLTTSVAFAESLVTLPAGPYWTGAVVPVANGTYGYGFTIGSTSLRVTSLGLFGQNLSTPHAVGIWDNSGSLLGTVTIPGGSVLPSEGGFEFSPLQNPVTLFAGQTYVLGANYDSTESAWVYDPNIDPGDVGVFSTLILSGNIRRSPDASFAFLSLDSGPGGLFGPNALVEAIPEPHLWAAIFGVALAIRLCRSILSRKRQCL